MVTYTLPESIYPGADGTPVTKAGIVLRNYVKRNPDQKYNEPEMMKIEGLLTSKMEPGHYSVDTGVPNNLSMDVIEGYRTLIATEKDRESAMVFKDGNLEAVVTNYTIDGAPSRIEPLRSSKIMYFSGATVVEIDVRKERVGDPVSVYLHLYETQPSFQLINPSFSDGLTIETGNNEPFLGEYHEPVAYLLGLVKSLPHAEILKDRLNIG